MKKLEAGTKVRFTDQGAGFKKGDLGEIVDWITNEKDGQQLYRVRNLNNDDIIVRAFYDAHFEPAS